MTLNPLTCGSDHAVWVRGSSGMAGNWGHGRCPRPHSGLWSLPGVSSVQHVALIGLKSECYHPPQAGVHTINSKAARCRRCCPCSAAAMGYVSLVNRTRRLLRIQNQLARECLAELLAVFVLILITLGGSAQMVTSSGTKGNIITSSLAGALAVMVAIYTAGGVSGAHLNPAFSLSMSLLGQLPWWKFPIFVAVQIFGSFIAAGAVYALYYDAIWSYSNGTLTTSGPRETASIFATYPAEHLSLPNGFLDQVVGTAVLIVGILAITDTRNRAVPRGLEPPAVALLVLSIEVSMGSNCSCPMNPARDLGPRLFTLLAGWGTEVFSRGSWWWWVPVLAPLVGAVLGTALYQLFVAFHHPDEEELDGGRACRQTRH
ncbi:aquaporin-10 [Coturnix japonica]|uniref:aquaporin-10 n=1 Tax=Coturnix japonica TaxID=93934 RepID=UPI0013A5CCCF|nr:aquaporin-10 [Coturnix japonica]